MPDSKEWTEVVDREILLDLQRNGPDYVPLVANRCGIRQKTVKQRCQQLVDDEYLEKVSEETLYRISERGRELLRKPREVKEKEA